MTQDELVREFWDCISREKFEDLLPLFAEHAQVFLRNTREVFESPSKYITFNRAYPGRWKATIDRVLTAGDKSVSITLVSSDNQPTSFYVTSYFEFKRGRIQRIEEYWG